jgi:hypothetical protein
MPSKATAKRKATRIRARGRSVPATDMSIINSSKATGSTTTVVMSDVLNRRQNFNLVETPPKQIGNQIYWFKESVTGSFQTSTSTYSENNFQFQLSSLQGVSSITAMFDQYAFYAISTSFMIDSIQSSGGNAIVTMLTALDYDNISNIGPSGIVQYSSYAESCLSPSVSLIRLVRPCVAPALYSGSAFSNFGTARLWCNSSSNNTVHYGLRAIALQTAATVTVRWNQQWVIGCRNTI